MHGSRHAKSTRVSRRIWRWKALGRTSSACGFASRKLNLNVIGFAKTLIVKRIDGIRVTIYPNDHHPAHVHATGREHEAVFDLRCTDGPSEQRENYRFPQREIAGIRSAPAADLVFLCDAWGRIPDNTRQRNPSRDQACCQSPTCKRRGHLGALRPSDRTRRDPIVRRLRNGLPRLFVTAIVEN